jgi:eukaryotic-like serine/threonine-protein kinase
MAVTTEQEQPAPERKPLRMVECGSCRAKIFISGDLKAFESVPCTRCGHPVCMPLQLRQFELRSIIASGGMGTVYRAFDLKLHRMVALKMLRKDLVGDAEVLASFDREARATASLNHTNIIHIYTFDEFEGQPYLVMELADTDSLDKWIERDGRLPELNVLDIGIKIASALDTALKHNLLHRDIKPANILFNEDKEPKLVDFGLARVAAEEEAQYESTIWATPYYVAPEKIRRETEDYQSDMYSLAGTLYHSITGRVPFDAPTVEELILAHVNEPLVPPIEVIPEISPTTNEALVQAMAKKPSGRFRTYDQFIMALTASRSQLLVKKYVVEQEPEPPPEAEQAPPEEGKTEAKTAWWRR